MCRTQQLPFLLFWCVERPRTTTQYKSFCSEIYNVQHLLQRSLRFQTGTSPAAGNDFRMGCGDMQSCGSLCLRARQLRLRRVGYFPQKKELDAV